jgi:hypothetical protein
MNETWPKLSKRSASWNDSFPMRGPHSSSKNSDCGLPVATPCNLIDSYQYFGQTCWTYSIFKVQMPPPSPRLGPGSVNCRWDRKKVSITQPASWQQLCAMTWTSLMFLVKVLLHRDTEARKRSSSHIGGTVVLQNTSTNLQDYAVSTQSGTNWMFMHAIVA